MEIKVFLVTGLISLLVLIIYFAKREGSNAEKIKRLKEEIKQRAREQAYAQSKIDMVRNLSSNDINDRLRKIANKK